jgi:hypothetical protein
MSKGVKDPTTFDSLHVPEPLAPAPPPAPPMPEAIPTEELPAPRRAPQGTPPPGVPRPKRDTDEHWPEADRKATVRDKPAPKGK